MNTVHVPESVQQYLALTLEEDRTGQEPDNARKVWEMVCAEPHPVLSWVDVCRVWFEGRTSEDNRQEMLAMYEVIEEMLNELEED